MPVRRPTHVAVVLAAGVFSARSTSTGRAPTKPFMIGEFASSETGGNKAAFAGDPYFVSR
jgi:hypothetical protein